ncbi:DUF3489 domain-containing protein [Aquamicrobium sp.]|uniref:DUF3489 domain-containing protein n=1 Tax=Aquamicrobium sp. TaxID=1872579 RepID=UPI00258A4AEC|nr:DUF3489 domain-containing protein [Aquamicrobium sp.]MCK9553103.1 DUF3489 domain-containing protein [Aquamicrobium sp.]
MTKTIRLNDLQLVLLSSAAGRETNSLIPLSESCAQDTTRVAKAVASLLSRNLVEEKPVTDRTLVWRTDDDVMIGLFINQAGRNAIGAGEDKGEKQAANAPAGNAPHASAAAWSPHPASKTATVLSLLQRTEGATLDELVAATGWLAHTARAALTGLRKKGHTIDKTRRGDATCYSIAKEG